MEKIDSIFLFLCILNLILAVSFIFIEVSTTTLLVSAICGWFCYMCGVIKNKQEICLWNVILLIVLLLEN